MSDSKVGQSAETPLNFTIRDYNKLVDGKPHESIPRYGDDTFVSGRVSKEVYNQFVETVKQEGIDPNAHTRYREKPYMSVYPDEVDAIGSAVYQNGRGEIVCDVSVIEKLMEKGKVGRNITVDTSKAAGQAAAEATAKSIARGKPVAGEPGKVRSFLNKMKPGK